MQHVSPNPPALSLDALCAGIIALRREPIGLVGIVLLSEIDRLVSRSVQPDGEILRRATGFSKSVVWSTLDEMERSGFVRLRQARRIRRLALTISPAGRQLLADAARALEGFREAPPQPSEEADELPAPVRIRNRPPRALAAVS